MISSRDDQGIEKHQRKRLTPKELSLTNPCKNPASTINTAKGRLISYNKLTIKVVLWEMKRK